MAGQLIGLFSVNLTCMFGTGYEFYSFCCACCFFNFKFLFVRGLNLIITIIIVYYNLELFFYISFGHKKI